MFWKVIAIENTKNFRRTLLWAELILLSLVVISIFLFLGSTIQGTPQGVTISPEDQAKIPGLVTWPGALEFVLGFVTGTNLGTLLLVVFTGAVTAQEYTWRTYRLWLSRGTPRSLLLGAKFTALFLPTLVIVLTALVSGAAISAIFSFQMDGALHLEKVNFCHLGLSLLRAAYSLLPYLALTFLLAIATRSAVAAIGGGLAYALFIESFLVQALALSNRLGGTAKYLPVTLAEGLLSLNQTAAELAGATQPGLLDPLPAAAGIAIWTVFLLTLALWIFRRQDFSG